MSVHRCTGRCCAEFTIHHDEHTLSPSEVLAVLNDPVDDDELVFVANAIPFLGPVEPDGVWFYTCRHFDGRDCLIYATRPSACRCFGEAYPCPYPDCELRA